MSGFEPAKLNDVIHGRVRLALMAYLMTAGRADFSQLKAELNLSDGNLSVHLRKLEEAGYVHIEKSFIGRKPHTSAAMTDAGRAAFSDYLDSLEAMLDLRNGTGK